MRMTKRQRVLFLCTGNSARSQMAEGLLRHIAGDQFEVFSAGTRPVGLNPNAITAMSEIGINIAGSRSIRVLKTLPLPQRINNCRSSGKYAIRLRIDCRSLCAASIRQSIVLELVART